jgi:L-threonylcarbamoyladenylate synthase
MIKKFQTDIVEIDPHYPQKAAIERAAALLRAGEVVVFPTETVYGLGASALQPEAVQKIFVAKERPYSDPLIAHIADLSTLEQIAANIPPQTYQLAQAFWPGPLTLILPADECVPHLVTAGLPTVGIRMPGHPVALALIRAASSPIAAPSANRFMHVSPTTARHVLADLNGRVPLILDGGPCKVGVESTILDLCAPIPTILRPGGVSLEALRSVIPEVQPPVQRIAHKNSEEEAPKAPGQMLIHYAPKVPAILFEGPLAAIRQTMLREIQQRKAQGERVGVLVTDDDQDTFQESGAYIYTLGNQPELIATRLYAGLRELEEAGVQVILCRSIAESGIGLAIHDRLLKATGGKVIHSTLL